MKEVIEKESESLLRLGEEVLQEKDVMQKLLSNYHSKKNMSFLNSMKAIHVYALATPRKRQFLKSARK